MGVKIVVREGELLGQALRRHKKLVWQNGIMYAYYRHRYRLKPCEERRRKRGNAKLNAIRAERRRRRELGLKP
jgi:ribosomal protein S21